MRENRGGTSESPRHSSSWSPWAVTWKLHLKAKSSPRSCRRGALRRAHLGVGFVGSLNARCRAVHRMTESTTASVIEPGMVLAGKFRIEQVLGQGGMGVVVAAHHLQLDERVALKFLLPEALGNPEA